MWIDVSFGVVALLTAMLGGFVTFWPPKRRKWKITLFVAFCLLGLTGLGLIAVQSAARAREQRESNDVQQQLKESSARSEKELVAVKKQLDDIQKTALEPGSPADRLAKALDGIGKVLGSNSDSRQLKETIAAAAQFDRQIALAADSKYKLSTLMIQNGYKGSMELQALYIRNTDESGEKVYWGQADISVANSPSIDVGDGYNFPGGADARQVYLLTKKDMKIHISARSK